MKRVAVFSVMLCAIIVLVLFAATLPFAIGWASRREGFEWMLSKDRDGNSIWAAYVAFGVCISEVAAICGIIALAINIPSVQELIED